MESLEHDPEHYDDAVEVNYKDTEHDNVNDAGQANMEVDETPVKENEAPSKKVNPRDVKYPCGGGAYSMELPGTRNFLEL